MPAVAGNISTELPEVTRRKGVVTHLQECCDLCLDGGGHAVTGDGVDILQLVGL